MAFDRHQNPDFESRMQQRHAHMTERALVLVFEFGESAARQAVHEILDRFPERYLRDEITHEGPLNLAATIAKKNPTELIKKPYADRLPTYYKDIQPLLDEALNDYNTDGKRIETEARIRERARRLWEQAGRPEGRKDELWLKAEQEIAAEANPSHRLEGNPATSGPDGPTGTC